jgi:hypothetical protein
VYFRYTKKRDKKTAVLGGWNRLLQRVHHKLF